MKAMILAAGLGTRLRPLTDSRPKALVEVAGRTLLEITVTRLRAFGVTEVIVNVHHFADLIIAYLKSHNHFGMRIEISREDDVLLDTGGGLKKAAWFFLEDSRPTNSATQPTKGSPPGTARRRALPPEASIPPDEPFILHNVDVISTIDFRRMLQFHNEHRALATLAVQSRASTRRLLFNQQLQLCGRRVDRTESGVATQRRNPSALPNTRLAKQNRATNLPVPLAFSGIHIISPRLLPRITEDGVFSIMDVYLRLASEGEEIFAFRADEYYWRDLGRPGDLSQAARELPPRAVD